MTRHPTHRETGSAVGWQAAQLVGTRAIFFLRLLVLARLLAPDDFGLMAIAVVALGTVMSLTDFGVVSALVQRADATERQRHAAWTIGILRAGVVSFVLIVTAPGIASAFGDPRAAVILQVLALRPLLEAAQSIRIAELTRALRFRALAMIPLAGAVLETCVAVTLAAAFGIWALVVGTLVGATAATIASYVVAPLRPRLVVDAEAARPTITFGRWILAAGVAAVLSGALFQAVISRQMGAASLGVYFLASKLAFLPYDVAKQLVAAVAFPLFARLSHDREQLTRVFRGTLVAMSAVLLPGGALLFVLAPTIVTEILGPRWQGTAPLVRVLSVAAILALVSTASVPLFKGLGRPAWIASLEMLQGLATVGAALILIPRFGLLGAAAAWVLGLLALQCLAVALLRKAVSLELAELGRAMSAIAGATAVAAGAALVFTSILPARAGLPIGLVTGGWAALVVLRTIDRRFAVGLSAGLQHLFPAIARFAGPSVRHPPEPSTAAPMT